MKVQWFSKFLSAFMVAMLALVALPATRASALTCNSNGSGNWNVAGTWSCGRVPINGTDTVTIQNGHNVTVTANATFAPITVNTGGTLTINNGVTLTIATNAATPDINVNGTVVSTGALTLAAGATATFGSGSTYQHNTNGGTIPTATWDANSTVNVTGVGGTAPTGFGQTFGNLIWNSTAQTADITFQTNITTLGNFTISSTGTGGGAGTLRLTGNTTPQTLNVGGNFSQSSGEFRLSNNTGVGTLNVTGNFSLSGTGLFIADSGGANAVANVTGNVSITGGTLRLSEDTGTGTLNVAGNFSHTGGTITETNNGSGAINFTGTTTFASGGTVSNTINFTVNSGATLNMGTSTMTGNSFTLSSNGTLGIGSPNGITTAPTASGNIQTTTRTYNTGANYTYNGGAAQVTGTGLPATVNNLTINNAAGVTKSNATTLVNGTLTLTNGVLTTTAANSVNVAAAGNIVGGSATACVNGPLSRGYNTTGANTFPVCKSGVYRHVTFNYTSAPGASTVTVEQFEAAFPGSFPGVTPINRYWTISDSITNGPTFLVTLDGTGIGAGTVVMLKQDGSTTSNATGAPNYTNTPIFNTLSTPTNFTLGIQSNSAPTATNLSAAETYNEDTPLNLIDIVISDVDSANVTATLTLSNPSAGSLNTGTSGAVTSTYIAGTGVWTATGALANVNTLLAGLTFTPASNFNSNFTIATSVSDGVAAPITGTKNMTGTPVNDAPTASNLSAAETYNEDTPLNMADIVISDIDSANVTATLTLSNPSAGSLNTGTSGAVTSTYIAGTGVWTATGALANVNTLLAGLTFTPASNFNSNFTIATSVSDGVAAPITGTKNMTGTPVNDAPTASNLSGAETYIEDTPLNLIDIVIADVDSANVTAILTLSNTSAGSLNTGTSGAVTSTYVAGTGIWTASGAIADVNTLLAGLTFTPASNFNSNFTIATSVSDGVAAPITGTKNMTGTPVNDAPSFTAGANQTVNEDAGAQNVIGWATNISAGHANESAQTLTFDITGNDNPGLFSAGPNVAANGTLTYTPAPNANGVANITLTLSDNGGTANGGVDTSASQSFIITINSVDDAPVTSNVTDTTSEDTAKSVTLAYIDQEGDQATSCSVFGVANGSISTACACSAGTCTVGLTPALNSTTSVTANFTVDNGTVSNASLITLNVNAVNDAPVTSNVTDTTNEDTEKIITLAYIDTESDQANSCSVFGIVNGSVSTACACAGGNCTVGITPALNSSLQVTANYTVDDGAVSNTSSITVDVNAVDDNPTATGDSLSIPGNTTSVLDVLSNDSDVDGGPKQVASVTAAGNGTATNNSANISYTPNSGYCGPDTFDYTLNGGSTATVTLDIVCSPAFTSANNTTFDFGFSGTFNVTAVGNPATMTITMTGAPAGITLTDNGNGTATLDGDGSTPVGVYNLIFTADNGVTPNGIQNFTLTIRNGPTASKINSSPDTGDGNLIENENISTELGITQLTVEFSREVYDDPTDTTNFDDDVTNPANYILVRSTTGTFATTGCSTGVKVPDVKVNVNSVTYTNSGGKFIATLSINDGLPLNVEGFYKLFVCGTTSIVDATNLSLSLAGDGSNPGTDFVRNFRIAAPASSGGGSSDDDSNANARNKAVAASISQGGFLIPVTGFAPQQVTMLPAQTTEYASSKLTLESPSISLKMPIVGVQFKNNTWDVTWLGNNAGYLEGSAYPTVNGNTVLTGHVTDPNGKPGPFAHLTDLQIGQKIYIHNDGFTYVYDIRQSSAIQPSAITTLFEHEEDTWLSIVTCENFDAKTGKFLQRRLIRAVLISIIPTK